ncbi:hypothetical protein [Paraconexibacter algicola]|uniref:hypothetical protein n=1 Tax=Paraconexibacter algicola TaxID=2133960 RepID=UPI0011B2572B|nr:hypothetical protein [Paraconexibacter algicola]
MVDRIGLIRLYALLVLGSLALHEVRYALPSGQALEASHGGGHGYLALVSPLVGMVAALVLATGVLRAAAAASTTPASVLRVARLWPLLSAGVFGLYAGQELLEGALAHHHPERFAAVFGSGGWMAMPTAIAIGAALAFTVRIADAAVRKARDAGAIALEIRLVPAAPALRFAFRDVVVPRAAPLRHRAGRGPPRTV